MARNHKIGGRGKNKLSLKQARKLIREAKQENARKTLPYSGLCHKQEKLMKKIMHEVVEKKGKNYVQETSEV